MVWLKWVCRGRREEGGVRGIDMKVPNSVSGKTR